MSLPLRNLVCSHPSCQLQYLTGVSGKTHCFGLQIYPILDNVSLISGSTNSAYEIWRTWDDCLWFQQLLEDHYGTMSREKRHRLQAGRGVKKNGVYIHDRAASFESLPPGPDPKSVATDIHQHLPKLAKRGTFFGATQATVDQRQREFSAFIKALFQKDLPSLIVELRDDRAVRDFFGYWRRDSDLVAKKSRPRRPKTAPDGIRNGSFISSFFSTSSVSLSPPPIHPQSTSLCRRSHTTDSTLSLPYAESVLSDFPNPPSSAPARLGSTPRDSATSERERSTIGRKSSTSSANSYGSSSTPPTPSAPSTSSRNRRALSLSHRPKPSSSPQSETFNVTSDFPLFLSSSSRNLIPPSRRPQSPSHVIPGLGTLQEDTVLDSPDSNRPPPTLRGQKIAPVNTERANRSFVGPETDEVSSSEGDVLELLTPVDGTHFNVAVATPTLNGTSEHAWPSSTGSNDSRIEIDLPHITCTDSFSQFEGPISPPTTSSSSSTLRRSCRRRSLSQPLPVASYIPTDVGEGDWSDHAEDTIDAFLGGAGLFASNEQDSIAHYDEVPSDFPLDVSDDPLEPPFVTNFSTPRQEIPDIDRPPRTSHRPRVTASRSRSHLSRAMSTTSSVAMDDTLVVKATFNDVIVGLRARRDVSLKELRQRVLEKFARTEGLPMRGAFELSYLPPAFGAGKKGASMVSLASTSSVDWSGALPLRNERDWATAIASSGSKITLRVSYPTETPRTHNAARTRMARNYV
jgi:hypothetical protein